MLAMVVNENVGCLIPRGDLTFIASMLAPKGSPLFDSRSQHVSLLNSAKLHRRPITDCP